MPIADISQASLDHLVGAVEHGLRHVDLIGRPRSDGENRGLRLGAIGGYLGAALRRWTTPFPALSFLRGNLKLGLAFISRTMLKKPTPDEFEFSETV